MDFKELDLKIKKETGSIIYNKKLLKALAKHVQTNDELQCAFECSLDTTKALLVATNTKILLTADEFLKKAEVLAISKNSILDLYLNSGFLAKQLVINTHNKEIILTKIKSKNQIDKILNYI